MKRYDYSRTTPVKPLFNTPSGRFVYYDEAQAEISDLRSRSLVEKRQAYLAGKDEAQTEIDKAIKLLDAAFCPCCDKSGAYYDNDGGACQCQWCAEVEDLKHKGVKSGKS